MIRKATARLNTLSVVIDPVGHCNGYVRYKFSDKSLYTPAVPKMFWLATPFFEIRVLQGSPSLSYCKTNHKIQIKFYGSAAHTLGTAGYDKNNSERRWTKYYLNIFRID